MPATGEVILSAAFTGTAGTQIESYAPETDLYSKAFTVTTGTASEVQLNGSGKVHSTAAGQHIITNAISTDLEDLAIYAESAVTLTGTSVNDIHILYGGTNLNGTGPLYAWFRASDGQVVLYAGASLKGNYFIPSFSAGTEYTIGIETDDVAGTVKVSVNGTVQITYNLVGGESIVAADIAFAIKDANVVVNSVTAQYLNPLPKTAQISWTEEDDVITAVAAIYNSAVIGWTEDDDAITIAMAQDIPTAQIAWTEEDDVITAVAAIYNSAVIGWTEDDDTVTITAEIPIVLAISWTEEDDVFTITATTNYIEEPFRVQVLDSSGDPVTGLTTVYIKVYDPDTGYTLDFSDSTFKASPTTPYTTMSEVDATYQSGWYSKILPTTVWSGWYEFEAYYDDGTTTQRFYGESYYVGGLRINGTWSISETTRISAIQAIGNANQAAISSLTSDVAAVPTVSEITADIDANSTIASDITYLTKIINNVKEVVKIAGSWYLVIYDTGQVSGGTEILRKKLTDKNGNGITDLAAGVLAAEMENSV